MPIRVSTLQTKTTASTLIIIPTGDVIYVASNMEETNPGASGQVQDHPEHHRDDQEQLLDNL